MLKSLDILIGFSVIMLVVSMTVTVVMQIVANALQWRGKHLVDGVATLLNQIDPTLLTKERARTIAGQILSDPMVKASNEKFASVIHREELIKIVLQLAAAAPAPQQAQAAVATGQPVAAAPAPALAPNADCMQMLAAALRNAGIPDPARTLDSVRMLSMRLEAASPEMATHAREALAIITEAESQFVAKVNGWFDQTMDRVSQAFAVHTRLWTASISVLVAVILQLDAVAIVNRLAMDDNLRNSLVEKAQTMPAPAQASQQATPSEPAPTPQTAQNTDALSPEERARIAALAKQTKTNLDDLQQLATSKLFVLPGSPADWIGHWGHTNIFGVVLSALLLSLGAPFWFDALQKLLKLRPMLASKDDAQRQERLSQQPAPGTAAAGSPPLAAAAAAGGERGDLNAG